MESLAVGRLGEQMADERAERLQQRRVRDVAVELVELAAGKISLPRGDGLVNFADQRGFTDARKSGHQQQRRIAFRYTVETIQQKLHFLFAAIEFFRYPEPVGIVVRGQIEVFDFSLTVN